MPTQTHERRKHPRLPLHLSVAKLVDFQIEGLDGTAPAVMVDLSAGGLAMICFAMPPMAQKVTFRLKFPGLVNAQVHGKVVRVHRKGETYHVAVEFTEFREEWAHMISKLVKSHDSCQDRWNQGDRAHCPKECAYHKAFPREEA
jgi:hypothetical protein